MLIKCEVIVKEKVLWTLLTIQTITSPGEVTDVSRQKKPDLTYPIKAIIQGRLSKIRYFSLRREPTGNQPCCEHLAVTRIELA